MKPKVLSVEPLSEYRLKIRYETGESRLFDCAPLLEYGMFRVLKDESLFKSVRPFQNTVEWLNGADIDPDRLWEDSVATK